MGTTHSTSSMPPIAGALLRRLVAVEPIEVPLGEAGIPLRDEQSGETRICVPVLSVYLDLRPVAAQGGGERPAVRPGRTILTERLREIERTFWPRGVAFDAVHADAARIEQYLESQVDVATPGIAIFASVPHGLFETVTLDVPVQTELTARALPDLFQLARVLGDQETVVIALAHTNAVRLFVSHRGGLREVRGLADDPKLYHLMHGANAMNQAHYQRHAIATQAAFAREAADQIERLIAEHGATEVLLAGEARGVAHLRQALSPHVAARVREMPHSLAPDASRDAIWEVVAPLLAEMEAERDRSIADRLMEAVRADALGVVGLARTLRALQRGQVDVLVLAANAPIAPEARSELIDWAIKTDATIEVVDESEALWHVGGVGALLRYRLEAYGQTGRLL
jgi:ribosomal protein L30E